MSNAKALRPLSKLPLLTVETISTIYGETDADFVMEILEQFRTEASAYMVQVEELKHCGALDDSVRLVHSLKTMAAMVGAEKMSRVCKVFEHQLRANDVIEIIRTYPVFAKVWQETLLQLDQHIKLPGDSATDATS